MADVIHPVSSLAVVPADLALPTESVTSISSLAALLDLPYEETMMPFLKVGFISGVLGVAMALRTGRLHIPLSLTSNLVVFLILSWVDRFGHIFSSWGWMLRGLTSTRLMQADVGHHVWAGATCIPRREPGDLGIRQSSSYPLQQTHHMVRVVATCVSKAA